MPKLTPKPIVYLADRVRQRFYQDHPWETLRPRTLVEGVTLSEVKAPHPQATDLLAWGRNPSPEE
jgi:small subunit ribosomal protein S23